MGASDGGTIFPAGEIEAMANQKKQSRSHIILTSHPGGRSDKPVPITWGAPTAAERGPVIGTVTDPKRRNVIGTHSGSYAVYRALAVASGALSPLHIPDLTNTAPAEPIGPFGQWFDPEKIVSLDPWGHMTSEAFAGMIAEGYDIRPTIAVTKAHLKMPEIDEAMESGRLRSDNRILGPTGNARVTKAAVEPVWYLPAIAGRFGIEESELRRGLFEYTGGMFPELVTRPDLKVFLPPIGGHTLYFFGDLSGLGKPETEIACRVHDECNGSDVFGSDICTCRPYLTHGIEVCIETAQRGGLGIIVYNRKEGRALGEVTKFLVYNARKRQEGGDRADRYFERTECVAGVQDVRFQQLMPDVLHWLGLKRIDRFVSMSDMKHDHVTGSGIEIGERVPIPDELVPPDARVEIDAKIHAGYHTDKATPTESDLTIAKGRSLND
jgi:GTP cyclohydrolase II